MVVPAMLLLIYAALHDLAARTVPNWVSGAIVVLGLGTRLFDHNLLPALAAALLLFLFLFAIWIAGLMGGGDVKLWVASSLLIPPYWQMELMFLAYVMLLGGVWAVFYLLLSLVTPKPAAIRKGTLLRRVLKVEQWRINRRAPLPYACAISGGALILLLPYTFQS